MQPIDDVNDELLNLRYLAVVFAPNVTLKLMIIEYIIHLKSRFKIIGENGIDI